MEKVIRYLPRIDETHICDWKEIAYSDKNILDLTNKLGSGFKKGMEIELSIWEYENAYYLHSSISEIEGDSLLIGSSKNFEFCKLSKYDNEKSSALEFKNEAYRIKELLKKRFYKAKVTSRFDWRGII